MCHRKGSLVKRLNIDGEKVRDRIRRGLILFAVAAFLVGSVGIYIFVLFTSDGQGVDSSSQTAQTQTETLTVEPAFIVNDPITELKTEDQQVGTGAEAKSDSTIKVKYKGGLAKNGQIFDQSTEPIELSLDAVIVGWKEGIPGMKVGGKRKLLIPAAKGYGEQGAGTSIPANSDLVFEVELVEVK